MDKKFYMTINEKTRTEICGVENFHAAIETALDVIVSDLELLDTITKLEVGEENTGLNFNVDLSIL